MGVGISTIEGKESEKRPWADLPHDILLLIFEKLGTIDLLLSAQAVCTSWRQLALEPRLWHCIDLRLKPNTFNDCVMEKLTFKAIDRSNGYIEEFYAGGFIWDDTFTYIANRTSGLRRFGLIAPRGFTEKALMELICHCPLLEELEITHYFVSPEDCENIKWACPKLNCIKLNMETNEAQDSSTGDYRSRTDWRIESASNSGSDRYYRIRTDWDLYWNSYARYDDCRNMTMWDLYWNSNARYDDCRSMTMWDLYWNSNARDDD